MAWNPSPKVADCRDLARKYGANKVVVLLINDRAGTYETVSYGSTRRECDEAKVLADMVFDATTMHYENHGGVTP
jgi:hypothetical protein